MFKIFSKGFLSSTDFNHLYRSDGREKLLKLLTYLKNIREFYRAKLNL